ncbi:hypothetical protein LDENG_00244180 [Lucifuga dentata]|nr:hypothetical protein LDENG_00244180 [Lucifuga dentata]
MNLPPVLSPLRPIESHFPWSPRTPPTPEILLLQLLRLQSFWPAGTCQPIPESPVPTRHERPLSSA